MQPVAIETERERIRQVISRRISGLVALRGNYRAAAAAAVGTTETRISRAMAGSSDLSAAEIVLLARHLKIPVGVLMGEENPPPGSILRR